ncbi:MAG: hypothetical protein ACI3YW_06825 [Candidatus Egerieousia sp.]
MAIAKERKKADRKIIAFGLSTYAAIRQSCKAKAKAMCQFLGRPGLVASMKNAPMKGTKVRSMSLARLSTNILFQR